MPIIRGCPIVAIEEHYADEEMIAHFSAESTLGTGPLRKRLLALDGERGRDMDKAGIDLAVLSHTPPSAQALSADIAVAVTSRANNRLAAAIAAEPSGRFAAFAALPTAVPEAAADELERCVGLGFKGGMVHGRQGGDYLDLPLYWPLYERAQALDVPIYMHPGAPSKAAIRDGFEDYADRFPTFSGPAWGFTVSAGTQAVRMVLSGVFERYPGLKIILGHLGESIPFELWRIDSALSRPGQDPMRFREAFTRNFWLTTSGFFSTPALQCCISEMGVERILFAVDWPFVTDSGSGVEWLKGTPLSGADRARILGGNALALLRM